MATEYTDPETNETKVVCGWPLANGRICRRTPNQSTGLCSTHESQGTQLGAHHSVDITVRNSRYAGVLSPKLLEFETVFEEDDFFGMTPEIRIIDARTRQLLASLPEDTLADKMEIIIEKMTIIEQLFREGDGTLLESLGWATFKELQSLIATMRDDRVIWQEILTVIEGRRKLVESERKRAIEAQQIITQKQASLLLQLLLDIINRHVTDRGVKDAIAADITRLADNKAVNRTII